MPPLPLSLQYVFPSFAPAPGLMMMHFFIVAICNAQLAVPGLNKPCSKAGEPFLHGLADLHASLRLTH